MNIKSMEDFEKTYFPKAYKKKQEEELWRDPKKFAKWAVEEAFKLAKVKIDNEE